MYVNHIESLLKSVENEFSLYLMKNFNALNYDKI